MEGPSTTTWRNYCSGSVTTTKDMIEQAKEELQILEAQQPNRFNYLKNELKSFISYLEESQNNLVFPSDQDNNMNMMVSCFNSTCYSICCSVKTRESSAGKKRKKCDFLNGEILKGKIIAAPKHKKFQRVAEDGCSKTRERIDVVIERAQECLQKIQQFKTTFS